MTAGAKVVHLKKYDSMTANFNRFSTGNPQTNKLRLIKLL